MAKGKNRNKAVVKPKVVHPQVLEAEKPRKQTKVIAEQYSGPLPPPAMLQQYNDIHPDFADRIISSWENETAHRRTLEEMAVKAEVENVKAISSDVKRGQWLAFLLSIGFLFVGGTLVYFDKEISGVIFGTSGFLGIVLAFLNTAFKSRDNNNKVVEDNDD